MRRRLVRGLVFFAATACVAIMSMWYLSFVSASRSPALLALWTATGSREVLNALGGGPIEKRYVTGRIISGMDAGNADLTIHIVGPSGEGTLTEWAQNGFGGWHICSLLFRGSSGTEITVVSDANTNCERE